IEWCKARACANRWTEKVQLLLEEMRHVREFLSWHATWWDEQAGRRTGLPATWFETAAVEAGEHVAASYSMSCR
ncbi:hypothetical protein EV702DRAFT_1230429, partial [Suillus placidus]